jgi:hypothetical protein
VKHSQTKRNGLDVDGATNITPAETRDGSVPSAGRRALVKAAWVVPVIAAINLPSSGFAANISGNDDHKGHGNDPGHGPEH